MVLVLVGLIAVVAAAVLLLRPSGSPDRGPATLPPVGTWSEAPGLTTIRGTTTAVVLDDGKVLSVGGGVGAIALAATETYDPTADTWKEVARPGQARRGHQAVVLDDGRVLVAGGLAEGSPLASAELYDPATDTWAPTAPMATPRLGHSLTLLADGRVLVAGGSALESTEAAGGGQTIRTEASTEIFDPATGSWASAGSMASPRFEHSATLLADGRVLIVGGLGPVGEGGEIGPLSSTEIYDPAANAFVTSTDLAEGRANHAATLLSGDSVLVSGGAGGENGDISLASAEVFDTRAATWTTVAPLQSPRTGHTATRLADGRVLVAGGESVQRGSRRSLTSSEVFEAGDGVKGAWRSAGNMACPRSEQAAVLLGDGSVLVVAGDAAFPGQAPMAQSCVGRYRP
ncbi:MAG: Kelch repeat-containing protein [Acidimicrobiales bacterium]